ncbi:class I adenylate-forming enzyme family protein [Pseudooceanicola algae]|uniref:Long-chain-fatty-acid--CoA ligase n=1 Tax=Pseudooceanicola algae TaxID=1537215 RepID=A0A418SDZ1_9RHOB|nr:class I adenylate-forming enzyme family protein [Pseudooceanicola algae]QPM89566.1 Long-chain-fatty-acid--CoA ligase [Pseudooceanicola algae]
MLSVTDPGPNRPCPRAFNLAAHVLTSAGAPRDKIALSVLGAKGAENWTYGGLQDAVRGTATGLRRAGFEPGDILLMRLGNTVDFPIAYLGAIAAGVVPVPTSAQLTAPEVAGMIDQIAPAGILRASGISCPDTALPKIDSAALRAMRDLPPAPWQMGDPDRLAYVVFTSGTTGRPRAVAHAHRAIWARRMMIDGWYGMGASDRILHAGAFNWTFTLGTGLMDPWTCGATALIPAEGTSPADLPALLRQHQATLLAAVPGVYRKMLSAGAPLALPHLRHGLAAGDRLSDDLRDAWQAATGTQIHEAFGMSECSTFLSASPDRPADRGCTGAAQPGRHLALVDPGDPARGPVPIGEEGIIAIHRSDPGLMLGYLGDDAATADRFAGDWFLSGDLAQMQPDGQIRYCGRSGDMMNAGGYRVSPLEVETALATIEGLAEIGVTEVFPRDANGQIRRDVTIIVAFYTGPRPLEQAWLERTAATLVARYKQPRAWVHVPDLPRNPNGKLQRRALPALWEALNAS